ncbi:MAG: hypothetical protein EBS21_01285 [Sphingomonadaceae bacterium]|nr:hypothetical protein [Sphingomonadaceae bacterium]
MGNLHRKLIVTTLLFAVLGCQEEQKPIQLPSGIWNCRTAILDRGSEENVTFKLKIDGSRYSFPEGDPTYKQQTVTREEGKYPPRTGQLSVGPARDFDKNINPPTGSRTHILLLDRETPSQSKWFYVEYNGSRPAEIFYLDAAVFKEPPPYDGIFRSARCRLG